MTSLRLSISILLGAALLVSCQKQAPPRKEPIAVSVVVGHSQTITQDLTATGEIAAKTQSDLSFRLAGRVAERFVDVGSHVDKDQILARIDPKELNAAVTSAKAGVDSAISQLHQASLVLDRQKTLLSAGNTARSALDSAVEAHRVAQARLKSANVALALSLEQLGQTELRANAEGTITAVSVQIGQVIEPAQLAFTLAEDGDRDAVLDLSERQLLEYPLKDGSDVTVRLLSSPNVMVTGKIREISPTVSSATGTVRVKVALKGAPLAMTLGAAVVVSATVPAVEQISVPWQALTFDHGRQAVWIVDRDTKQVSLKTISVSRYLNDKVVIESGLAEGDLIVAKGAHLLHPKQVVEWENLG